MRCKGSPVLISALGSSLADNDNPYALAGRVSHALADLSFTSGVPVSQIPCTHIIDTDTGYAVAVTRDIRNCADTYTATVRAMAAGADLHPETTAPVFYGITGTVDNWFVIGTELQIHDLKAGRIEVEAAENDQLLIYAQGVMTLIRLVYGLQITAIRLVIHQPITRRIDEWVTSPEHVENRWRAARATVEQIEVMTHEVAERSLCPSLKTCRYCPMLKNGCPAADQRVIDITTAVPGPANQDYTTLGQTLGELELIKKWVDATRAHGYGLLMRGEQIPGWKLIDGKMGKRFWDGEDRAAAAVEPILGEQTYKKTLISPTQFGELVDKEQYKSVAHLIKQARGGYRLVTEKTKGEPVNPADHGADLELLAAGADESE